ncbi:MAG: hypothetical protein EOO15_05030 [Chitinophagaceae bacterium]|nr:MAG: hypothetical protein EOO15_05030 [Chitinophagaceae bacterium]
MTFFSKRALLLLLPAAIACSKGDDYSAPPAAVAPPSALPLPDDRSEVRLRSIEESGMPGPLFSFTYDSSGYANKIVFAAGFFQYAITYANKRVAQMRNTPDGSLLHYHYDGALVDVIHKTDSAGVAQWDYRFTYYAGRRLKTVEWLRDQGSGMQLQRKVEMTYDAAGELQQWKDFHLVNGTLTWLRTFVYSNYDTAVNVEGTNIFKSFFEDVLYLPSVRLQLHNPHQVTILGATNDFQIDYTYTYQEHRPVTRDGIMRQVRGGTANPIALRSVYTYF